MSLPHVIGSPWRFAPLVYQISAYALVSFAALAADYGLLLCLVAVGVHYLLASLLSFCVGLGVAYAMSARFVFAARRRASRGAEFIGFSAVGVGGLALTQILLYVLVSRLGLSVALAKLPVVGVVFFFNFFCRRTFVFVPDRERPAG